MGLLSSRTPGRPIGKSRGVTPSLVCLVTTIVQDWDLLLHGEEIFTSDQLGVTVSIIVWPDAL